MTIIINNNLSQIEKILCQQDALILIGQNDKTERGFITVKRQIKGKEIIPLPFFHFVFLCVGFRYWHKRFFMINSLKSHNLLSE